MFYGHPTGTGGGGKRVPFIDSRQPGEDTEEHWVYCYQCGFPNDLREVKQRDALDEHGTYLITTTVSTPNGGTKNVRQIDDAQAGGCRFCHSKNLLGLNKLNDISTRKRPESYRG